MRGANCSLFKSEPDNDRLRGETCAHNNTCEFKEKPSTLKKSLGFFKKKREEDGDVARSNARGRLELTSTRTGLFKRGEIFMIF